MSFWRGRHAGWVLSAQLALHTQVSSAAWTALELPSGAKLVVCPPIGPFPSTGSKSGMIIVFQVLHCLNKDLQYLLVMMEIPAQDGERGQMMNQWSTHS